MNYKKTVALLLCCAMLAGLLAGCGDEEKAENLITYVASYYPLASDEVKLEGAGDACSDGTHTYFIGYVPGGKDRYMKGDGTMEEYETTVQKLFRVNMDGTGLEQLPAFEMTSIPEGFMGNSYINRMGVAPDGSPWVMENVNTYTYNLPEDFDPITDQTWNYYEEGENQALFRKLNSDGSTAVSIDLIAVAKKVHIDKGGSEEDNYFWIYSVAVDKAGNIYFYDGMSRLIVLDANGDVLFTIEDEERNISDDSMVTLNDGRVAVYVWGENRALWPVDVEAKGWSEEPVPMPLDWNRFYNGQGDYLYYYSSSSSLFGCKSDGTFEKMFTWLNCDVDQGDLNGVTINSVDQVTALESRWDEDTQKSNCQLVVLNRTEIPPEQQKKTITLAVMWLNWNMRRQILDYNRKNTEYRIEVQDYSEFNTEDDYTAGLTKLTVEILTGKVPDIIVDSDGDLPMRQYAAKGLLEDLLPYIEADTELGGKEALFQPVLNAMLQDGKLYRLASSFAFRTAFTSKKIAGDVTGWTVAEAKAALDRLPEGAGIMNFWTTQQDLLEQVCVQNMSHYINWDTGECTFDTGDFEKLLEFSTLAPKEITEDMYRDSSNREETRIREGRQLMQTNTLYDWYDALYARSYWGDDMIYVGLPSEDRDGNAFRLNNCMAISSKCKYKDAAWQFVRNQVIGESSGWGFSMNKAAFDSQMERAMTVDSYTDEEGNVVEYPKVNYWVDDEEVKIYAMSQEDYDMLMNAMESTTKLMEYDDSIRSVIMDEAQAFIDGNATASQVAANVQNRVKLYVNEQR